MRFFASVIIFATVIDMYMASTCGDVAGTNGCSTPVSWTPYRQEFSAECDKHDVCYSCGYTFGISKDKCEDAFYADLKNYCSSSGGSWWCRYWAWIYYKVVDTFGHGYLTSIQPWCKDEPIIKEQCLPLP